MLFATKTFGGTEICLSGEGISDVNWRNELQEANGLVQIVISRRELH
jgi:hypothetical protein